MGPRLWLANVEDHGFLFSLEFSHFSTLDLFLPLLLLSLSVLLDIVELSGVHPGFGEEVVVVWELLLESLEVHSEGALPADVVHSEEVVGSLADAETAQEIGSDPTVGPENVPVVGV